MLNLIVKMPSCSDEENIEFYNKFNQLIEQFNTLEFLDTEEIDILVTECYCQDVKEYSDLWNLTYSMTVEKEYSSVAKMLTNPQNGIQHKMIIDCLKAPLENIDKYILHHLLTLKEEIYLPKSLIENKEFNITEYDGFYGYLKRISLELVFKWDFMNKQELNYFIPGNTDIYVEAFQRKIKKIHLEYQIDNNLAIINQKVLYALEEFIRRCFESFYCGCDFNEAKSFKTIIYNMIFWVQALKNFINVEDLVVNNGFIETINNLLELCFIKISKSDSGGIFITITDNPKKLFHNELLDTQNYIVAFVDILGFSEIIKEYDSNINSNKLKELKKALEDSISYATIKIYELYSDIKLKNWGNSFLKETINLLEYRMFSDCFCFALPYFDTQNDITVQFASIAIVLRIFQYLMLKHGFMIRGGISFGSYYSDANMLFSGGLVQAYKLEAKFAKMPRIIIDKELLSKIRNNNPIIYDLLGLTNSIVQDPKLDDFAFINPFGLEKAIKMNLSKIVDNIEPLYEHIDIKLSELNPILEYIKCVSKIPQYSQLLLSLDSPFMNNQLFTDTITTNELISKYIEKLIQQYKLKLTTNMNEEELEETKKIYNKYFWFYEFMKWSLSDNEEQSDRFYFLINQ